MYFRGATALSIDAKGRMAIPSRYRERLLDHGDGNLVITIDPDDPCLWIYPLSEWTEIERKLDSLPSLNEHIKRFRRLLMGYASDVEMDGAGRILLPSLLRERAGLDKQVMLIGQGRKFELWSEQTWNERRDRWLNEEKVISEELPDELQNLVL